MVNLFCRNVEYIANMLRTVFACNAAFLYKQCNITRRNISSGTNAIFKRPGLPMAHCNLAIPI